MLTPIEQLGIVAAASIVVMFVLWLVQRRTRDAGVVDVGWSYGLGASALFCAMTGEGAIVQRAIAAAPMVLWSARLGTHILTDRVLSGKEDGRYAMLREKVGARLQPVLLVFFQFQAVLIAMLSIPVAIVCANPAERVGVVAWAGLAVWCVGLVGETMADRQLKAFKRRADSAGRTCRAGLWRYSRHPNYFFEWLMWVAYAMMALAAPGGAWALIAPALMLLLVLKVTGIPPTEARAIKTRGEDYREYQRSTSAFVPWPVGAWPFAASARLEGVRSAGRDGGGVE